MDTISHTIFFYLSYLFSIVCRNERPFQCTICEKSYKTSSMRAAHMDSHITGKTFEVCSSYFRIIPRSLYQLDSNIYFCSLQCQLCQKKMQSRTSYRNHMKRHTEEKKHICECGKRFFTKYHLRLHYSKIHEKKVSQLTSLKVEVEEYDEDNE